MDNRPFVWKTNILNCTYRINKSFELSKDNYKLLVNN